MDWSNEPYVKLYTRETDDDLVLSWQARAVWHELLKKLDRSGVLQTRRGARGVAAAVRIPLDVVTHALAELLDDGRLQETEAGYFAPNFIAAQEAKKSDKLRQKEARERRAARASEEALVTPRNGRVTKRDVDERSDDETSRGAAVSDENVTLCSADPDPLLSEASRAHARDPRTTEYGPRALARGTAVREQVAEDPNVVLRRQLGNRTWDRFNDLRRRIGALLGEVLHPLGESNQGRGELQARIRETGDEAEDLCDRVLAVLEHEARRDRTSRWLLGSAFGIASWDRALAQPDPRLQSKPALRVVNGREVDEDGNVELKPGDSPYGYVAPEVQERLKRQAAEEHAEYLRRKAMEADRSAKRGRA